MLAGLAMAFGQRSDIWGHRADQTAKKDSDLDRFWTTFTSRLGRGWREGARRGMAAAAQPRATHKTAPAAAEGAIDAPAQQANGHSVERPI